MALLLATFFKSLAIFLLDHLVALSSPPLDSYDLVTEESLCDQMCRDFAIWARKILLGELEFALYFLYCEVFG